MKWFHDHGYGNTGATSGHLVPDHAMALQNRLAGIHADLSQRYEKLSQADRESPRGAQLRAMMTAATMPRELAAAYSDLCSRLADETDDAAAPAGTAPDGGQPETRPLGTAPHLLGSGPGPVDQPHAGHE